MNGLAVDGIEAERGDFRLGPVSFAVPAGTATVLLGPSGAGKTTLLRALAGFLPLRAGTIRFDGAPVDTLPPEHRGFGFVPPNLGLFPHRRVRWNVRYPLALRGAPDAEARTDAWIERFGLGALAHRFIEALSSGERQRVAMARALAAEPRALLWDEPLAALDVESRDTLVRLLRDLLETERIPLLLVTHDPTTAFALASRVVVVGHGRVRVDRTPEELAHGPLDRFLARFLGYENLYGRDELTAPGIGPIGTRFAAWAGAAGLAVPPDAIAWRAGSGGPNEARVVALRWTAAGWVVALRQGPLTLHAVVPARTTPGVRVGDPVSVEIDPAHVKPLEEFPDGGVR